MFSVLSYVHEYNWLVYIARLLRINYLLIWSVGPEGVGSDPLALEMCGQVVAAVSCSIDVHYYPRPRGRRVQ